MNNIHESNKKISNSYIVLLLAVAYIFSFAIRLIWVYQFSGNESFMWNGQLMINTNDGYYFASGAQKWLEGTLQYNPRVPGLFYTAVVTLSAFAAKYLPFSLDTAILYMPAVISSLVVIPLILIGRLFGMVWVGFFAALLGSIAWSYYNRTMVGYFDTDMFSAMATMFIVYFLAGAIRTKKLEFALAASAMFAIYPYLYDSGSAIILAMGIIFVIYKFVFHRQDSFAYQAIALVLTGALEIYLPLKIMLVIGLYVLFKRNIVKENIALYISLVVIALFFLSGNMFEFAYGKFMSYFDRGMEGSGLHFYQVHQTIREAGKIPFDVMANRISGSQVGVILSLIGYVLLLLRYKAFLITLPLIGIGLFSLVGGLRFTVYAVPIAAFSAIYLFHIIASYARDKRIYYFVLASLTAIMIYPNITHIIQYRVPTVMNKQEVAALDKLKTNSSPKDYVVAWWDYGYPIWYYADKNTLIDGGKHNNDNFIVSEIMLTDSPLEAARLSRLAVEEYVSSDYKLITNTLFKNNTPEQVNVSDYLDELRYGNVEMPENTRDIYLYLPWRMMRILPTIKRFSNLDLNTGKPLGRPFFYSTQSFKQEKDVLLLGQGIAWFTKENKLRLGNEKRDIGKYFTVGYTKKGKLNIDQKVLNPSGKYHIIYMSSYRNFLIVDDAYLNSLFIQMFVFENYDKELFEPVILDPLSKIYKLKI